MSNRKTTQTAGGLQNTGIQLLNRLETLINWKLCLYGRLAVTIQERNARHLHQALKQCSQEKLTKYTVTVLVFSAVCSYLICCLYNSTGNLWVETIILIYFSCCPLQDAKGPYYLNLRHKNKFKHVIFFHEEQLEKICAVDS